MILLLYLFNSLIKKTYYYLNLACISLRIIAASMGPGIEAHFPQHMSGLHFLKRLRLWIVLVLWPIVRVDIKSSEKLINIIIG